MIHLQLKEIKEWFERLRKKEKFPRHRWPITRFRT